MVHKQQLCFATDEYESSVRVATVQITGDATKYSKKATLFNWHKCCEAVDQITITRSEYLMSTSAKTHDPELRYRWQVANRILLAVAGGYLVTNMLIIVLSYALPLSKSDAVVTASLLSFAIFSSWVVWVFSVKNIRQAWWGLLISTVVLLALILAITYSGGES